MTTWLETSRRWLGRIGYRVQQFLASLWPLVTPKEQAELRRWLPSQAVALFLQMALRDQRHSLNVLHQVQKIAQDQPDLLAAALLHDVAKTAQPGRRVRLHHRVLAVLMEAVRPGWVEQVALADPGSWRYPFYLHLHHPDLGARLAESAGCSTLTVELIRRHQKKLTHQPGNETERLLILLQATDDVS
ncbi:MAG TPA: HD domain-containing protein [Anaerolineae bacterium]|nr:HD domain-containing protein [Anaerolineae bacterium]